MSDAANDSSPHHSSQIGQNLPVTSPNEDPFGLTSEPASEFAPVAQTPEKLYLRVNRRFLRKLNPSTGNQLDPHSSPPPPDEDGNLYLIVADLSEIQEFAGNTVDWLIQIAGLIFEPLGLNSVYTFQTETVEYWLDKVMDESWASVAFGDRLRPTIYEFRPNRGDVLPTRISLRQEKSVTSRTLQDRAAVFRAAVTQRQPSCVISQWDLLPIATHLIPRRLGDIGIRSVFRRFTGFPEPELQSVDSYHHFMGVTLCVALAHLVEIYEVGFWNVGPDQYEVHNFANKDLNIHGTPPFSKDEPKLHRRRITLTRNDKSIDNPPIGLFNWHYIQCVLRKFATSEYASLPNIHHFDLPFNTRDDDNQSDVDFDDPDNINNPPYPSYYWDLAWSRTCERLEEEERCRNIVSWRSSIS